MDIANSPGAGPNRPSGTAAKLATDYNTYLRMLTTQLRYQDPLDPVDSSDYAAQLAAFSTVEQQVATNDLLSQLNERFDLLGMAQLSAWVGQEALTTAPVQFDGTPVTLNLPSAGAADDAVLVVRDAAGNVVAREEVPKVGGVYTWLGGDATGSALADGRYALTLEAATDGAVTKTVPVPAYARIEEAVRSETGVKLRLKGGIEVDSAQVTALRVP